MRFGGLNWRPPGGGAGGGGGEDGARFQENGGRRWFDGQ